MMFRVAALLVTVNVLVACSSAAPIGLPTLFAPERAISDSEIYTRDTHRSGGLIFSRSPGGTPGSPQSAHSAHPPTSPATHVGQTSLASGEPSHGAETAANGLYSALDDFLTHGLGCAPEGKPGHGMAQLIYGLRGKERLPDSVAWGAMWAAGVVHIKQTRRSPGQKCGPTDAFWLMFTSYTLAAAEIAPSLHVGGDQWIAALQPEHVPGATVQALQEEQKKMRALMGQNSVWKRLDAFEHEASQLLHTATSGGAMSPPQKKELGEKLFALVKNVNGRKNGSPSFVPVGHAALVHAFDEFASSPQGLHCPKDAHSIGTVLLGLQEKAGFADDTVLYATFYAAAEEASAQIQTDHATNKIVKGYTCGDALAAVLPMYVRAAQALGKGPNKPPFKAFGEWGQWAGELAGRTITASDVQKWDIHLRVVPGMHWDNGDWEQFEKDARKAIKSGQPVSAYVNAVRYTQKPLDPDSR